MEEQAAAPGRSAPLQSALGRWGDAAPRPAAVGAEANRRGGGECASDRSSDGGSDGAAGGSSAGDGFAGVDVFHGGGAAGASSCGRTADGGAGPGRDGATEASLDPASRPSSASSCHSMPVSEALEVFGSATTRWGLCQFE